MFCQLHYGFILFQVFLCLFMMAGLYMFVYGILNVNILIITIGIIWALFIAYEMFVFSGSKIVFRTTELYVSNDKLRAKNKIQHEASIRYEDIKSVRIIKSASDSRSRKIGAIMPNSNVLKTYLEILSKESDKVRFLIFYYSSKQRRKILEELKNRTYSVGNDLNYDVDYVLENVIVEM